MTVPEDFPRSPFSSALPGAQTKFVAREIDGKFVVGLTEDELQQRYDTCIDLLEALVTYAQRKLRERRDWGTDEVLERVRAGVLSMDAGFSAAEIAWLSERVKERIT